MIQTSPATLDLFRSESEQDIECREKLPAFKACLSEDESVETAACTPIIGEKNRSVELDCKVPDFDLSVHSHQREIQRRRATCDFKPKAALGTF